MLSSPLFGNKNKKCTNASSLAPDDFTVDHSRHQIQKAGFETLRSTRDILLAKFINQIVAANSRLSASDLLRFERGKSDVIRARQIAVYLMHTTLSFTYTQIANVYGKDRTTISHACRLIEDLRDETEFDYKMVEYEATISIVLKLSDEVVSGVVSDANTG